MKKILLLLMLVTLTQTLYSQCDGNLGENIFTDGDFGSGTANILFTDPQIAPGYGYTTNPPPMDGNYTITNNTTSWGSFASNWADIQDNSSDPNGYMMVVNASYDPGLFYEQEVQGLCENTLYVFSADVFNLITGGGAIKPNVSFLLDGVVVFETGDIPTNQQWNTYGFTFTTDPGQTNITLALSNNAPGGGGNDLAIDNITFRACGPEALILPQTIENICEDGSPINLDATINGDQYDTPVVQWQQSFDEGQTWVDLPGANDLSYLHTDLTAGIYYYRYLLANNPGNLLNSYCRVVSNVKIVNVIPKFYTIIDTLCEGLTYPLKDSLYTETGIYVDSLLTYLGCDSIVTLELTIIPDPPIDVIFSITNPSCIDVQNGNITLDAILNGIEPYSIFIDGELNPTGNLSNIADGAYDYLITDKFGCSFETVINLGAPTPFIIELGENREIELGDFIAIDPVYSIPAENFIWQSADSMICDPSCETLNWAPNNSTVLTLTATASSTGCLASDTININVTEIRKVYIPNAFSPNLDGFNDNFTIFGAVPNILEIEQILIFDRWGAVLFENNNFLPNQLQSGWDGTYKGRLVNEGIYTYLASVRFLDGKVIIYSGDISLLH